MANGTYLTPLEVDSATAGVIVDPGVIATVGMADGATTAGRIIGTAAKFIIDGGGTFNPLSNNTYTGATTVQGGSTLLYTISEGQGSPATNATAITLTNGNITFVGQSSTSSATAGITTFAHGFTVNAPGGTINAQQGTATAPYLLTLNQVITGAGPITFNTDANSIINLTAANTMTSGTTISSGSTVRLSTSGTLGSPLVTNNGTLQVYRTATIAGGISGSGVTNVGDGTTSYALTTGHIIQSTLNIVDGASGNSKAVVTAQANPNNVSSFAGTSKIATLNFRRRIAARSHQQQTGRRQRHEPDRHLE